MPLDRVLTETFCAALDIVVFQQQPRAECEGRDA